MTGRQTNRKWWTLGAVCVATFMLLLDITVVNTALPKIQQGPRRQLLRPAVGDRRLRALARRAGAHRGLARRPARPPPRLRRSAWRSSPSPRCSARSRPTRPSSTSPAACRASAARSCSRSPSRWSPRSSPAAPSGAWRWASTAPRSAISVAVGPLVGGVLTDGLGWQSVFLVNVPVGIATIARHLLEAARVARPERHADRLGRRRHLLRRAASCSSWRWSAATTRAGAAR